MIFERIFIKVVFIKVANNSIRAQVGNNNKFFFFFISISIFQRISQFYNLYFIVFFRTIIRLNV